MTKKVLQATGVGITTIVLASMMLLSAASAQSGTIDTTGPDSENVVTTTNAAHVSVHNNTHLSADVDADQDADSGDAKVWHNTDAGSAETGDATNDNTVEADVEVDNSSSADAAAAVAGMGGGDSEGTIEMTGPDSTNQVIHTNTVDFSVDNNTCIKLDVDVDQDADSGDARVSDNTMGGDATTGDASNSSHTSVSFSVMN